MTWTTEAWLREALGALKRTLDVDARSKNEMVQFLLDEGFWDKVKLSTWESAIAKFNSCLNPNKSEFFKVGELWALSKRFGRHDLFLAMAIRFDSKKEASYYEQLKLRQRGGEVHFWLRQVPVHLPDGTKYVLDIVVFLKSGEVQFVDVKGRETKEFRIKKREVEHHYPFRILLA